MKHPTDHKPEWETPLDDRGHTIGEPTRCKVCGVEPVLVRCVNCGQLESEVTISHGSFGKSLHSTTRKTS